MLMNNENELQDSFRPLQAIRQQPFAINTDSQRAKIHFKDNTVYLSSLGSQIEPLNPEQKFWKPKIPNKKLSEKSMFFISVQKKKIRNLNGINATEMTPTERNSKKFRGNPILVRKKHTSQEKQRQYQRDLVRLAQKTKNEEKKSLRTPIVNFHLRHLLQKSKKLKSQQRLSQKIWRRHDEILDSPRIQHKNKSAMLERLKLTHERQYSRVEAKSVSERKYSSANKI